MSNFASNVIIKSNSFQYICRGAFIKGAHNRMHFSVYSGGGGGAYEGQFTVCDCPGFEI